MSQKREVIAAIIAAELMELTATQRVTFKFPDDINGDTTDRAYSCADRILRRLDGTPED